MDFEASLQGCVVYSEFGMDKLLKPIYRKRALFLA